MKPNTFEEKRIYDVSRNDVLKAIYFICRLTQNQNGKAMSGALSSKQDLMGGIFDRWINIIPESIVFNKGILPKISNGKKVEVISDFYSYDPSGDKAGIAPDVIGLRINDSVIPFVKFNEKWVKEPGMPQIELKTFKKADYMVSLRNQGYDEKYLVMVQSDFRVDYLIPFLDKDIFDDSIYDEMKMDDSKFIISNENKYLSELQKVESSDDKIGTVSLISITRADSFMKKSTHCETGVSVEWLKKIEEVDEPQKNTIDMKLSDICFERFKNLYSFNDKWYSGIDQLGIPYRSTKKKNGTTENLKVRTLDFYVEKIQSIKVIKLNKLAMMIKAMDDNNINGVQLEKGKCYLLTYSCLPREGSGEEYFMQKDIVSLVDSFENELTEKLKQIIINN